MTYLRLAFIELQKHPNPVSLLGKILTVVTVEKEMPVIISHSCVLLQKQRWLDLSSTHSQTQPRSRLMMHESQEECWNHWEDYYLLLLLLSSSSQPCGERGTERLCGSLPRTSPQRHLLEVFGDSHLSGAKVINSSWEISVALWTTIIHLLSASKGYMRRHAKDVPPFANYKRKHSFIIM